MKISNELLSWVMGYECEILTITETNIVFKTNAIDIDMSYIRPKQHYHLIERTLGSPNLLISIDTFLRLAKIKAFEAGYIVDEQPYHTAILDKRNRLLQTGDYPEDDIFSQETVIMMLEWVREQIK